MVRNKYCNFATFKYKTLNPSQNHNFTDQVNLDFFVDTQPLPHQIFAALSPPRSISITGQNSPIDPLSERVAFIQATIDDNIDPLILLRAQHPGKRRRGVLQHAKHHEPVSRRTSRFRCEHTETSHDRFRSRGLNSSTRIGEHPLMSALPKLIVSGWRTSRPAHTTCSGWRTSRPAHGLPDATGSIHVTPGNAARTARPVLSTPCVAARRPTSHHSKISTPIEELVDAFKGMTRKQLIPQVFFPANPSSKTCRPRPMGGLLRGAH
eukprot:CAMPEP_0185781034 /NCGR_PEP_ID=MMETSP1174-20130828/101054_1 /TAXON_ID=35687 /ORGANISM="Dictyocha speculum, Strain CCMP1381" /LENGTH=264 /DNA_ID=CAMNT_0028470847 /DNA_START=9 /DNA_END=801 /DNA_ORIENTATION=+